MYKAGYNKIKVIYIYMKIRGRKLRGSSSRLDELGMRRKEPAFEMSAPGESRYGKLSQSKFVSIRFISLDRSVH